MVDYYILKTSLLILLTNCLSVVMFPLCVLMIQSYIKLENDVI